MLKNGTVRAKVRTKHKSMSGNMVRVARIGKPHGIHGEVTVEVFTESPGTRFAKGSSLILRHKQVNCPMSNIELTVKNARWNKKILLLKFEEIADRDAAESLRDCELYFPVDDLLDEDEGWYAHDLVGMTVHNGEANSPAIGKVTALIPGLAQDLLEITLCDGREALLPFVEEIVPEINKEGNVIVITPPPGLLELNQD